MIELKFKYESRDYQDFARALLGIRRLLIAHFILWIGIFSIIIASAITDIFIDNTTFYDTNNQYIESDNFLKFSTFSIAFLLAFLFFIVYVILGQYFLGGKKIENLRKGISPNTRILINDEVLDIYSGEFIREIYNWNSVKDVYNTKNLFIIFISDFKGIIIPKRVFKTKEEAKNCWDLILACYNNKREKRN